MTGMNEADPSILVGRTIFLVEDQAIIALELQYELESAGARVIGPAHTLEKAEGFARRGRIDAAILDMDLRGEDSDPVAEILTQRNIPFLIHTGHGEETDLDARYPGVPVLVKPVRSRQLLRILAGLL